MTRFVSVTVLVMLLAAGGVARAQDASTLPNGASIWFEHLEIIVDGKSEETELTSDERLRYFNLAHCNCAREDKGMETRFSYLIHASADPNLGRSVQLDFWAGSTTCTNDDQRNESENCRKLETLTDIDVSTFPSGTRKEFKLFDVINGKQHEDEPCLQTDGDVPIYAFANTQGNTTSDSYDFKTSQNVGSQYPEVVTTKVLDTKPPPLPTQISATSTDGGIRISWKPPETDNTDISYYQALCAKIDGTVAREQEQEAKYVTTASLCEVADSANDDPALQEAPLSNGGTPVTAPSRDLGTLGALDEKFICGHVNGGTSSSLTITGLENGTEYQLILLTVDLHGNYIGAYLSSGVTPVPAVDFWEDLHDRGSDVEGGFCLLAETYGDNSSLTGALRAFRDETLGGSSVGRRLTALYYATAAKLGGYVHGTIVLRAVAAIVLAPVVALALLWHWLTLPGLLVALAALWGWRRGRRSGWLRRLVHPRSATVGVGVAMLLLGRGHAHAGGYQPYWENTNIPSSEDEQLAPDDPSLVKWHAGIRVGPYLPGVDKQLKMTQGSFKQMFGGARPMPMLDVDRVLWTGFGQVAIGGSVGYMQWFAHQFAESSDPTQTPRLRSPGDTNTFRLIPLALTASYRFTYLDDEHGIPVVPYVRAGLAYDIWWLKTNGDSVCKDRSDDPMCERDPPHGGSIGATGSIGLSIRAERIDASTANSMRQSGIQHAGIYAELSLAKVDGFGSDKKLSVGDSTWFAGVDFEF